MGSLWSSLHLLLISLATCLPASDRTNESPHTLSTLLPLYSCSLCLKHLSPPPTYSHPVTLLLLLINFSFAVRLEMPLRLAGAYLRIHDVFPSPSTLPSTELIEQVNELVQRTAKSKDSSRWVESKHGKISKTRSCTQALDSQVRGLESFAWKAKRLHRTFTW